MNDQTPRGFSSGRSQGAGGFSGARSTRPNVRCRRSIWRKYVSSLKNRRNISARTWASRRTIPTRGTIGPDRPAADQAVPAHLPDRGLAGGVLKQDVGTAVGSDGVPTRPGVGAHRPAADQGVPLHLPDRDLARALVLEKDVGKAVFIEIARSNRLQAGPGWGSRGCRRSSCSLSFPRSRFGRALVLEKDVGKAVFIEIARSNRFPCRPRLGADWPAADHGVILWHRIQACPWPRLEVCGCTIARQKKQKSMLSTSYSPDLTARASRRERKGAAFRATGSLGILVH
jgi:hypothetical protein